MRTPFGCFPGTGAAAAQPPDLLMMALTILSPAVGLVLYKPAASTTMLSAHLANPALAGGAAGAVLFGLLAILELDRAAAAGGRPGRRGGVPADRGPGAPAGPDPCRGPHRGSRHAGPGSLSARGSSALRVRRGGLRGWAYLLLMALALPLGVLAAAAAYQFTRRRICPS